MESASDISLCKRLLDRLDSAERVDDIELLFQLENIFDHLPAHTAPRLKKEFDHCIARSEHILGELFDKAEISDKKLLNSVLQLMLAYGNFRLNLITYHIESGRDELGPDISRTPILVKTKWYDLSPLLPQAGTISWKAILVSGLVKDPEQPALRATCMMLLTQKLHFYALINHIDRFKKHSELIQNNARRVAESISESIFDSANDDQEVVSLDCFTFNLVVLFIDADQQKALLEAIVVSRFKSELQLDLHESGVGVELQEFSNKQLDLVIDKCIMPYPQLQETLLLKLLEHLKCNIIRRKRRHSMEADEQDAPKLESLLNEIILGTDLKELLPKLPLVVIKSKTLQKSYMRRWFEFVDASIGRKTMTPKSSTIVISICSLILITCSNIVDEDLEQAVCLLLAKVIDATGSKKLDKLFQICNPSYLLELTKLIADKTDLLDKFETPIVRFYRSYFGRHMRVCTAKSYQRDVEKFGLFVDFICDRTVGKSKSTILGYTYLCELSDFFDTIKTKGKTAELYINFGRSIGKKLYSFIKNRPFAQQSDVDETNDAPVSDQVQTIVIDALVCVLKIAVDCKDQTMLDTYGELMLKLFNHADSRVGQLIRLIRAGLVCRNEPIDANLHRLINLYVNHKETIESYLSYDLNKTICEKLLVEENLDENCQENDEAHTERKSAYLKIKSRLETIQEQEELVFETIINRQYNAVVEQNLGQNSDLAREEPCDKRFLPHMVILTDVFKMTLSGCSVETYENVLNNVANQLERCNALDHPQLLSLLNVLGALIPRNPEKNPRKSELFRELFPTIGCSLVKMTKTVELGPSVLSFANPGVHKSSGGIQCCTYSNCIRIYTLIFNQFPPSFTNSLITDALQMCISANLIRYARYSIKLHRYFIQLASAIANLLKAISMGKRDIVEQAMPTYLSVLSLLIRCVILVSDRKKLENLPKYQTNGCVNESNSTKALKWNGTTAAEDPCQMFKSQLECLVRDMGRLLNNLCFLETKLVDYAPHLITTYVKDTQRASCPDFVKKQLDEGIFRIFNLVDAYQKDRLERITDAGVQRKTRAGRASGSMFDMIHARLDQASREIFRDMHDNYSKFHRYLGKC